MNNLPYRIVLPVFEGPLDLLLHLIEDQQLDIYDIPIASVTEQYLAYLAAMEELDLDIASEFLVMAATLLEIKARMLVPSPATGAEGGPEEEGDDPRTELVQRLLQYREFKEAAEVLRQREAYHALRFPRPGEEYLPTGQKGLLDGITLGDLIGAFREVLREAADVSVREIPRDQVTVRERMRELIWSLGRAGGSLPFRDLFGPRTHRLEVVVTFLAILELLRLGRLGVRQLSPLGEIRVFLVRRVREEALTGGNARGEGDHRGDAPGDA